MQLDFYVSIGSWVWGRSPVKLFCKGLGSCLAISFYDFERKEGGLLHVLLPFCEKSETPFYYVNLAILNVATKLKKRVEQGKIVAKLSGGANIFPGTTKRVGERNIEAARYWLKHFRIPIVGEDVGGSEGRNVTFHLSSGIMVITNTKGDSITL